MSQYFLKYNIVLQKLCPHEVSQKHNNTNVLTKTTENWIEEE